MINDQDADNPFKIFLFDTLISLICVFSASMWYACHQYGWYLGLSYGFIPSVIFTMFYALAAWAAIIVIPAKAKILFPITSIFILINSLAPMALLFGAPLLLLSYCSGKS